MVQNNKQNKLGTEKLIKLMFQMSVPGMVAQIINILYSVVDRIYIGHIQGVGAAALTGIGLTFPIITLVSAFAQIVGAGGAPLAAIELGRQDKKKAETILGTGVSMLLIFTVALMGVLFLFKRPLLVAFGASENTLPYADSYLSIYLIGTISVLLYLGLNQYIIAQGKAVTAMLSVGIGAVLNLILDPVFIFVLGMGVRGAAVATVISQTCSALWVLRTLTNPKADLGIRVKYVRFSPQVAKKITALGISPFIMASTESLIGIVINHGMATYGGDLYVGAYTIIQSLNQMIYAPVGGFTQGIQPIISYNYGAGNVKRVRGTYRRMILISASFVFVAYLTLILFPYGFIGMFTTDTELIRLTAKVLRVFFLGMLVFGIQNGIQPTFVALGQAKISLFIACLRKVILLVPLALILPHFWGVEGVYLAEPISDVISVVTASALFILNINKILGKEDRK